MPNTPDSLKDFLEKIQVHPAYQNKRRVQQIVDVYLDYCDFSKLNPAETKKILDDIRCKLQAVLDNPAEAADSPAEAFDTLFPNLNFRQQYEKQQSVMKKIVEMELHNPTDFYSAPGPTALRYNGCVYPLPDWEEVEKILLNNRETIRVKSAQGFTELMIVPFGLPIRSLAETFKKTLKHLHGKENIINGDNQKVHFKNPSNGCVSISQAWIGNKHNYPRLNSDLQSKEELIAGDGPWQIHLLEKRPILAGHTTKPTEGESIKFKIPARQQIRLKNNISPGEYLEVFDELTEEFLEDLPPQPHHNEQLMYPETYLWMQLLSLLGSDVPVLMDHIDPHTSSGTILAGCINPANGNVLCAGWNDAAIFNLYEILNTAKINYHGIRTAVPLK